MRTERLTLSEWAEALPARGTRVFHLPEALSVLDAYASGDLRLLGGYRDDELVALVPLFVRTGPLGTSTVTSPPPGMRVPHMGPTLLPSSSTDADREELNRLFVEAVLDRIGYDNRTLLFLVCSPDYRDPRPYEWNGLSVDVSFTYHLEIGDRSPDDLLMSMSQGRRREIRDAEHLDVGVEHGGLTAAKRIYEETNRRLSDQNEPLDLSWPFVRDLIESLDDRALVHVARGPDDEFLGGVIALYSNDAGIFWLGGTRRDYENVSVNSLVHWDIIRTIQEAPACESVTRYDMVGAGIPRLSKYKSSFGPELRPYYAVRSAGPKMRLAETTYGLVNRVTVGLTEARARYARATEAAGILLDSEEGAIERGCSGRATTDR